MMLQLIIEQGQPAGQSWPLNPGLTNIGRSANNDIILTGNQISRVHFVIEMAGPDQYVLTDKSTNGTLVNGRRAADRTPLSPGDRIQVGDMVLRCEAGAMAGQALVAPELTPDAAAWPAPGAAPEPVAGARPAVAAPRRRPISNLIPIAVGVIGAILILAGVVLASTLLAGQGATPEVAAAPTATATATAVAAADVTESPTPAVETTTTATATATAEVAATAAPAFVAVEGRVGQGQGLNVRSTPNTSAERLYVLAQQSPVAVLGRNDAGDWYLIRCQPDQPADRRCWVSADWVELGQPNAQLPVVAP